MARVLQLTQGKVAIVDDEDYDSLNQFKWHAKHNGNHWYAARRKTRKGDSGKIILLHVEVMNPPHGTIIDHINGDGLDCRKANLRISSQAENLRNRGATKSNVSGYKGVTWSKPARKWAAQIKVNYQRLYLGLFDSLEDAAMAYNNAAREYHGTFAKLNEIEGNNHE